MRYLIDGYNLLFRMPFLKGSLQDKREALIDLLTECQKAKNITFTLVFDAPSDDNELTITNKGKIKVIYTSPSESADEYLHHLVETSKKPSTLCVVTSDGAVRRNVQGLGAKTKDSLDFLQYLLKLQKRHFSDDDSKTGFLPSLSGEPYPGYNFHLREFEKRANEDEEDL